LLLHNTYAFFCQLLQCIDCLGRVVEKPAAAQGVDKAYAIEGADHRDICKPGSMTDPR
jgi:hypothetical protein